MTDFHQILLKPKDPSKPLTGLNAILLVDGIPLRGVTHLTLELDAKGMAKLSLDMLASVTIEGQIELGTYEKTPKQE